MIKNTNGNVKKGAIVVGTYIIYIDLSPMAALTSDKELLIVDAILECVAGAGLILLVIPTMLSILILLGG